LNYRLLLREDTWLPIHKARELVDPRISRGLFKKLLKRIVVSLSKAVEDRRRLFQKTFRVKLETKPPCIAVGPEGPKLYTGQWVGIAEYALGLKGPSLALEIEPKYQDFHLMYQEVTRKLREDVFKPLGQLTLSLPLSSIKPIRDIRLALWLLEQYLDTTPPHVYVEEEGVTGHRLKKTIPLPKLASTRVKINEELYSTAASSIALIVKALKETTYTGPRTLENLVKLHLEEQQRLLSILLARPSIKDALIRTPEAEPNLDLCLMIKEAMATAPSLTGHGLSKLLLIPTTKTYELYVLLKAIEALGGPLSMQRFHVLKTSEATLYYNRPPKRLSRFIYRLSRSIPHPDILVEKDSKVIVIDAKYRELHRLELIEAIRLIGYMTDLAKDKELKAVIACLTKKIPDIEAFLNDLKGTIALAEVNIQRSELFKMLIT